MRHHVRCRSCRKRRVLSRHPLEYIRHPKCAGCGKACWTLDVWMMNRDTKKQSCSCDGYHFIHRIGSLKCNYLSDGTSKWPQCDASPPAPHPLDVFF